MPLSFSNCHLLCVACCQSHITTDAAEATATAPPRPDDLTGVAATSASGDEVLDAQTWIVQEYCDGGSLYDAARNGSLKQQQADGTLSLVSEMSRPIAARGIYEYGLCCMPPLITVCSRLLTACRRLVTGGAMGAWFRNCGVSCSAGWRHVPNSLQHAATDVRHL